MFNNEGDYVSREAVTRVLLHPQRVIPLRGPFEIWFSFSYPVIIQEIEGLQAFVRKQACPDAVRERYHEIFGDGI